MNEYIIKFWTKDGRVSGARIFAISANDAMNIAKDQYNATSIISWDRV